MRKLTLICTVLVLVFSISVQAQMRMSHADRVKQYQERLKLNEKQTNAVDKILTNSEEKMKNINTDDRTQRREEMMKIMDDTNKQIEKILTAAQKDELKKMIEERKSRFGGGMRPNNQ